MSICYVIVTELTFVLPNGLKDVLFEQKKIKFWNKWPFFFFLNKTEIMQHVLKVQ